MSSYPPQGMTTPGDLVAHAALTTGVHGAGASTLATTANITTHAALTTGTHGVGGGAVVGTTLGQVLTNKTLTAPIINGIVTTTGLTLPTFTMGGAITATGQSIAGLALLTLGGTNQIACIVNDSYIQLKGGTTAAGDGAKIFLLGKSFGTNRSFELHTPDVAGTGDVLRLAMTGNLATAVMSLTNLTITGIVLSGALSAKGQFVTWDTSLDSAAVADQVSLSGYEIGAGARALAISQEDPVIVEAVGASDRTLRVRINGTTYKILLKA